MKNQYTPFLEQLPFYRGHREGWCKAVIREFLLRLPSYEGLEPLKKKDKLSLPLGREIRISIAPIRKGALGICHSSKLSSGGNVNHIVISPLEMCEVELAHTILHELFHAIDDCQSRHRANGFWYRMASTFGMGSSGNDRNTIGEKLLLEVVGVVGRLKSMEGERQKKRSKLPALLKVVCPVCDEKAYIGFKSVMESTYRVACFDHPNHRMDLVDEDWIYYRNNLDD